MSGKLHCTSRVASITMQQEVSRDAIRAAERAEGAWGKLSCTRSVPKNPN